MAKKKAGRNKGKKYDKPVTLHPLSTEDALEGLLKTAPPKSSKDNKKDET